MIRWLKRIALVGVLAGACGVVVAVAWRWKASVREIRPQLDTPPVAAVARVATDTDWPGWRGAAEDNHSRSANPPTDWPANGRVAWRVPVPGRGHASPILWGDRVYVLTAHEEPARVALLALDRATGTTVWETELHAGGLMPKHEKNSHASATPCCDGERVYAVVAIDGAVRVTAVRLDGEIAWRAEAGPFASQWGYGASPILHGGRLIVSGENVGSKLGRLAATSFLAALDPATGNIVWRVKRPEEHNFGTPLATTLAGRPQLIQAGSGSVDGLDPATGDRLWSAKWQVKRAASTPAVWGDTVIASGVFPTRQTICLRPGDGPRPETVWESTTAAADVPSPLVGGDRLYLADDTGTVACLRAGTGERLWKERVATSGVSASPVWAAGKVYLADEGGRVHVFNDADEYALVATSSVEAGVFATPVVAGDRVYIRTERDLWCICTP